jgi:hypothetical protein
MQVRYQKHKQLIFNIVNQNETTIFFPHLETFSQIGKTDGFISIWEVKLRKASLRNKPFEPKN